MNQLVRRSKKPSIRDQLEVAVLVTAFLAVVIPFLHLSLPIRPSFLFCLLLMNSVLLPHDFVEFVTDWLGSRLPVGSVPDPSRAPALPCSSSFYQPPPLSAAPLLSSHLCCLCFIVVF